MPRPRTADPVIQRKVALRRSTWAAIDASAQAGGVSVHKIIQRALLTEKHLEPVLETPVEQPPPPPPPAPRPPPPVKVPPPTRAPFNSPAQRRAALLEDGPCIHPWSMRSKGVCFACGVTVKH